MFIHFFLEHFHSLMHGGRSAVTISQFQCCEKLNKLLPSVLSKHLGQKCLGIRCTQIKVFVSIKRFLLMGSLYSGKSSILRNESQPSGCLNIFRQILND